MSIAETSKGYSTSNAENVRRVCNARQTRGVDATYTPAKGFTGTDGATIHVFFPTGTDNTLHYAFTIR